MAALLTACLPDWLTLAQDICATIRLTLMTTTATARATSRDSSNRQQQRRALAMRRGRSHDQNNNAIRWKFILSLPLSAGATRWQTLATLAHHFADCCCDSIWHCALSHIPSQSLRNTKLSAGLRRQCADIQMSLEKQ